MLKLISKTTEEERKPAITLIVYYILQVACETECLVNKVAGVSFLAWVGIFLFVIVSELALERT
jgi:hypothetical protein